jgi:nitrogen-specific signal transduction histidine kinase
MGLGLAICQKIILDHRGELEVLSKQGQTTFIIKLPKKLKASS